MDPEEALVSPLSMALADGLASVLVQELADHGLRDRVNDGWIRCATGRRSRGAVHGGRRLLRRLVVLLILVLVLVPL